MSLVDKPANYQTSPLLLIVIQVSVTFDKPMINGEEGGPSCTCVSYMSFGHSGFTGTYAWADPETQMVYVFLSNRVYPTMDNNKLGEENIYPDKKTAIKEIYQQLNQEVCENCPVKIFKECP